MYIDKSQDRRQFFADLYESTRQKLQEVTERLELWQDQYKGSSQIDGSSEQASAVRNITYEIIESQIDATIPAPKVDCRRFSEKNYRNAKSVERLLSALRDKLPFERMNDMDERYTYIMGGSVWLVEWDHSEAEAGEVGDVKVSCISPRDFFPQPNIFEVEDMEYCFLRFTTTREDLMRRFHVSREQTLLALAEEENGVAMEGDTVTLLLCYYKDDEGDVCRFLWSGNLVLEDSPRYFYRKADTCTVCHRRRGICACESPLFTLKEELFETPLVDIPCSDGTVIPAFSPIENDEICKLFGESKGYLQRQTKLPYYIPKKFPIVIRKNTSCEKQLLGQSDCEYIRPAQQQINKVESRILQKLMRSAITPVVPEDAQITLSNQVFGQVIKLRPGESASDYGTVDTTPDISKDIAQAERLYDHAKRLIGISDAYTGLDQSAISGYSRQLQLTQSAGRLESKRRMKHSAYADIDRLVFSYYLAYADEPRAVTYKDAGGQFHNITFNRYDFLLYDAETDSYRFDDSFLFSIDQNGTLEGQRELMWERNLQNLQAGTLGDPSSPSTLLHYWQNQERVHYPFARENVEYFEGLVKQQQKEAEAKQQEEYLSALSPPPAPSPIGENSIYE